MGLGGHRQAGAAEGEDHRRFAPAGAVMQLSVAVALEGPSPALGEGEHGVDERQADALRRNPGAGRDGIHGGDGIREGDVARCRVPVGEVVVAAFLGPGTDPGMSRRQEHLGDRELAALSIWLEKMHHVASVDGLDVDDLAGEATDADPGRQVGHHPREALSEVASDDRSR